MKLKCIASASSRFHNISLGKTAECGKGNIAAPFRSESALHFTTVFNVNALAHK